MKIAFLHGFLGRPQDWLPTLAALGLPQDCAWDLEESFRHIQPESAGVWATQLSRETEVLVGYSMGGRLALEAARVPGAVRRIVVVGAHLGLSSSEERALRIASDDVWAERFRLEPWEELMHAWGRQAVFANTVELHRRESEHDRQTLANVMQVMSLGRQVPIWEKPWRLGVQVDYIVGARDEKFQKVALDGLNRGLKMRVHTVAGAGHRVPWEKPEAFHEALRNVLGL